MLLIPNSRITSHHHHHITTSQLYRRQTNKSNQQLKCYFNKQQLQSNLLK